jgi:dihydrolipoamide dehydrogenase
MKFELGAKIESAKVSDKGVELQGVKEGAKVSYQADIVLVAVGRKPFTAGLDLDKVGVKLTERGRIAVDGHWQTSVPGIYSIGDVIDGPMLAHKAHEEGAAVAERLAGKPGHVNYNIIPGIIYTAPEAAAVGLTEEEAKEKKIEVRVGRFAFTANGRAIAADMTEGFAKIIADAKTDRVLGAHIVAGNASELIAETVLLMEFSGSSEDLARTIHAHPTMSEAVKEAALAVDNRMLSA